MVDVVGKFDAIAIPVLGRVEDPAFTLHVEPQTGVVHSVFHGFWTTKDCDRYDVELTRFVTAARSTYGAALVMVDRRETGVQSQDVIERYYRLNRLVYQEGDHLAIIVSSSLAKLQIRRAMDSRWSKAFMSEDAARTWLSAFLLTRLRDASGQ